MSVDVPVLGKRLNEMKNNFTLPKDLAFPNILSGGGDEFSTSNETREEGPKSYGGWPPQHGGSRGDQS